MTCYKSESVPLDLDYIYRDKCQDMRGECEILLTFIPQTLVKMTHIVTFAKDTFTQMDMS